MTRDDSTDRIDGDFDHVSARLRHAADDVHRIVDVPVPALFTPNPKPRWAWPVLAGASAVAVAIAALVIIPRTGDDEPGEPFGVSGSGVKRTTTTTAVAVTTTRFGGIPIPPPSGGETSPSGGTGPTPTDGNTTASAVVVTDVPATTTTVPVLPTCVTPVTSTSVASTTSTTSVGLGGGSTTTVTTSEGSSTTLTSSGATSSSGPSFTAPSANVPPGQSTTTTAIDTTGALKRQSTDDVSVFAHAVVRDVRTGPQSLVAVGDACDPARGGAIRPAVWTATSSTSWRALPIDSQIFRNGESMWRLLTVGKQLIGLGGAQPGNASVLWTSNDGAAWRRIELDAAVFAKLDLVGIVELNGRWIAAATDNGRGALGPAVALLSSTDLAKWTRIPNASFDGVVSSIELHRSTVIVAGAEISPSGTRTAMLWISDDGTKWRKATINGLEAALRSSQIDRVGVIDSQLVAVGTVRVAEDELGVWTSPDGATWERVNRAQIDAGKVATIDDLAWSTSAKVFVAVGREPATASRESTVVVIASRDGREWTRVGTLVGPSTAPSAITLLGDQVIGVVGLPWDLAPPSPLFSASVR